MEPEEEEEELTAEELEELKRAAAERASGQLLEAAREDRGAAALAFLAIAPRCDLTAGEPGESYWTPLHYAALHGDTHLVGALIAKGAPQKYLDARQRLDAKQAQEQRTLRGDCPPGSPKAPGSPSGGGQQHVFDDENQDEVTVMNTPLHWSCYRGHMACALALLDAGYALGDKDSVGNTPLHLAAASQVVSVVDLLLSSGADPLARNRFGLCPLDLATAHPIRSALVAALKRWGRGPVRAEQGRHLDAMRKSKSQALREVETALGALTAAPPPTDAAGERARVAALAGAVAAAETTNGVVDPAVVAEAERQTARYRLSLRLRSHLAATRAQHPVTSQRTYCDFVNKLERFVKAAERLGCEAALLVEARREIALSFTEFWLHKIELELKGVEVATAALSPRIDLLEHRMKAAQAAGADAALVASATRVLERFRSEVALDSGLARAPVYKLPPEEDAVAELNKKQLAQFLDEYWDPDDTGHIKETNAEDAEALGHCHPYPLPPGFGKAEEDAAWAAHPFKALVNTPEGYIWVPSQSLVKLREFAKEVDVALSRATGLGAYPPLLERAKETLAKVEGDIQQLELKDEVDMTVAEAAAAKASKKLRKDLKGGKKKG